MRACVTCCRGVTYLASIIPDWLERNVTLKELLATHDDNLISLDQDNKDIRETVWDAYLGKAENDKILRVTKTETDTCVQTIVDVADKAQREYQSISEGGMVNLTRENVQECIAALRTVRDCATELEQLKTALEDNDLGTIRDLLRKYSDDDEASTGETNRELIRAPTSLRRQTTIDPRRVHNNVETIQSQNEEKLLQPSETIALVRKGSISSRATKSTDTTTPTIPDAAEELSQDEKIEEDEAYILFLEPHGPPSNNNQLHDDKTISSRTLGRLLSKEQAEQLMQRIPPIRVPEDRDERKRPATIIRRLDDIVQFEENGMNDEKHSDPQDSQNINVNRTEDPTNGEEEPTLAATDTERLSVESVSSDYRNCQFIEKSDELPQATYGHVSL